MFYKILSKVNLIFDIAIVPTVWYFLFVILLVACASFTSTNLNHSWFSGVSVIVESKSLFTRKTLIALVLCQIYFIVVNYISQDNSIPSEWQAGY